MGVWDDLISVHLNVYVSSTLNRDMDIVCRHYAPPVGLFKCKLSEFETIRGRYVCVCSLTARLLSFPLCRVRLQFIHSPEKMRCG